VSVVGRVSPHDIHCRATGAGLPADAADQDLFAVQQDGAGRALKAQMHEAGAVRLPYDVA
jgi:hypothetical protein